MKYIKYTECPISINGENLFAFSASLDSSASVVEQRVIDGELQGYSPTGPASDSVNVEYFATGSGDSISLLTGDVFCSGEFGGIKFSGACLTRYSFGIRPYAPISISASFNIYSGYSEELSAKSFTGSLIDVANGAQTDLLNISHASVGMDNPVSVSYSIRCERTPSYQIGNQFPDNVILGSVDKTLTLQGENIGSLISYSGKKVARIEISPKSINNISRGQSGSCSGIITSQSLAVSRNGTVNGSISITENYK